MGGSSRWCAVMRSSRLCAVMRSGRLCAVRVGESYEVGRGEPRFLMISVSARIMQAKRYRAMVRVAVVVNIRLSVRLAVRALC